MDERAVVTGFLRNRGETLLLRRSDAVGSYEGRWGAVAGHVEEDLATDIRREIAEETGIDGNRPELVRQGEPFPVAGPATERRWLVHPFLFDCPTRDVNLDWEHTDGEWTAPTAILSRETVPKLWQSYDSVRPSVETLRSDIDHGSATLSIRALEILRDEAALLAADRESEFESVEAAAEALLEARPSMAVIANRVHRAMESRDAGPAAVDRRAHEEISRALAADSKAAEALAARIDGHNVGTLSRSGTVRRALDRSDPASVLVAESRPGGEGVGVAEEFASEIPVAVTSDAAFPFLLSQREDPVLVLGADSILPDGSVLNKVGTRAAAAVATRSGIPVFVAAATDKIRPGNDTDLESRPASELYQGDEPVTVENPTFDLTPGADIDRILTENGDETENVEAIASEHGNRREWYERGQ